MTNLNNSNNFVNPHFDLIRLWLQEHIGQFITGLLILIYLATGFIIGMALQKSYSGFGITLSWIAGMAVAILAQAARGSLVYFGQANPYRLNGNAHLVGSSAALALTIYSSYEIYGLMIESGVTIPGIVSAIGLIIAGFLVEVFFLKELIQMNHATIVGNEELYQQVVEQEEKLSEIMIKTGEAKIKLLQSRRQRLSTALSQNYTPTPAAPAPENDKPDGSKEEGYTLGQLKEIIKEIVMEAIQEKEEAPEQQKESPQLSLNGNSDDLDLKRSGPDLEQAALVLEQQNFHDAAQLLNQVNGAALGNGQRGNGKIS